MISDSLLDQLADYAAGLLDEPAAAALRRRLASDPELAALAEEIAGAMDRAAADLAAVPVEPMPADVAARLDALIAAAPPAVGPPPAGARPFPTYPGGQHPTPARPESTAPEGRPAGTRSRTSRTRRGWLRGVAAGGGVLAATALVIGGFVALGSSLSSSKSSSGSAASAPMADRPSALIRHTGTDYTRATLPTAANAAAAGVEGGQAQDFNAEALSRLEIPTQLSLCLAAIAALQPGDVRDVDFARFEGSPALIVVLTTDRGGRTVVAGPECGVAGADEVYVTPER
jgi:hypothetical protein